MATNPQYSHVTVEEYLELDRNSPDVRYEYINGRVIMMAGGSPQHSLIAANITTILGQLLRESSCCVFNSDVKISLPNLSTYVYADAAVSCDQRDFADPEYIYRPRVIVEVLSPSTEILDRGEKFESYRACPSVQEYVMVNTSRLTIEVCRREKNNFWSFQTLKPGTTVELTSLGVHFPVSDVYTKVVFPGNNHQLM